MAVILTDDSSFSGQLASHPKVIVKYYADWCGSCRLFSPKYKRLSGDERFAHVVFLDVNAEKNPDARKKGEVKNLPTFAYFENGMLKESLCTSKEEAVVELLERNN